MGYKVYKAIVNIPFRAFFGFKIKLIGKENEPKEGPVVVCANHISMADPLFLGLVFKREISFMAKAELFKNKLFGKFLKHIGVIPVKRGEADIAAIKSALGVLKSGKVLGIFPEGTRNAEPDEAAKNGASMLANKTKASILPVAIIVKDNKVKFFRRVTLVAGEIIPYDSLDYGENNKDYAKASEQIMDRIYEIKHSYEEELNAK